MHHPPRESGADDAGDAGLDDGPTAICTGKPIDVEGAAGKVRAGPGGIIDCVAFGMFNPMKFFAAGPVKATVVIRQDTARQSIVTCRSDFVSRPGDDAAHLEVAVLRPLRHVIAQTLKPRCPFFLSVVSVFYCFLEDLQP